MDLRKLKTLIDLVEQANISELEITEGEGKVRIVKASPDKGPSVYTAHGLPVSASSHDAEACMGSLANVRVVTSPMVGTFYRTVAPNQPPFVEVGQDVRKGDILCIVEAMKLMNEVESEYNGRIKDILVDHGAPVEYGQALFVIE